MDPYKILGIEKDASPDEIRRAYRKKATKYHPDAGGEVWVFQQIQDAYDELTGKKKKLKPKKKPETAQPKPEPQPEPTKPFNETPFGDEPFEFKFENEEPRPKSDHWQTYSAKHGPTGSQNRSFSRRWLIGGLVAALCLGILMLGILMGRGSTIATADSAKQVGQPQTKATVQTVETVPQPQLTDSSVQLDDVRSPPATDISSKPSPIKTSEIFPSPILSLSFDGLESSQNKLETTRTTTALGKVGNALVFSNSSFAKVTLPSDSSIGTIAFWAKANRLDKFLNYHVVTHGELGSRDSFGIMIGQNKWRILEQNNGLNSWEEVDDEWHHHCVTKNGEQVFYYIDGIRVVQGQLTFDAEPNYLFLGNPGPTFPRGFDGCIDEFAVFSQALSKDQVNLLVSLGREGKHWSDFATVKNALASDNTEVRAGSFNGRVKVTENSEVAKLSGPSPDAYPSSLRGHTSDITKLAISRDGTQLVSASKDSVRLWELPSGKLLWTSTSLSDGTILALEIAPNSKSVWACGETGLVNLASDSGGVISRFDVGPKSAAISPNCTLALLHDSGRLYGFDLAKGDAVATRQMWASCISFSPDSGRALIGGFENTETNEFVIQTSKQLGTFAKPAYRICCAKYSHNGQLIALSSGPHRAEDKFVPNVSIFESRTGRELRKIEGFGGWQNGLAFSPNDRLLATVGSGKLDDWGGYKPSADNAVRIWEVATGKLVQTLGSHTSAANAVVFTPDGRHLITGGSDRVLKIWSIDP